MALTHKNQHWIPRVYLKSWVDPEMQGNVVHRYSADGAYKDYRTITRAFSKDDIYTVTGPNGERILDTEKALQRLERLFDGCLNALEGNEALTDADLVSLRLFIVTLRIRSPSARDHWQNQMNEVTAFGDAVEQSLNNLSPEQKQALPSGKMLRGDGPSVSLDEWRRASLRPFGEWLPEHILIDAERMCALSLRILKAPEGSFFITSDNPVTRWDGRFPFVDAGRFIGVNYPHLEIAMPISPRFCALLLTHNAHGDADTVFEVSELKVNQINFRTLTRCDKMWVSHRRDLEVDWI